VTMPEDELFELADNDYDRSQGAGAAKVCSYEGCGRSSYMRWKGEVPYCKTHYEQVRLNKPLRPIRQVVPRGTYTGCKFDGCDRTHSAKGYCGGHYDQLTKGVPLTPLRSWVSQAEWGDKCRYGTCEGPPHSRGLCSEHYGRGISQFARDAIFKLQGERCGICGTTEPGDVGWHLDHAHQCDGNHKPQNYCVKCVRGLLCLPCNRHGLAWYEESYRRIPANPHFPVLEEWVIRRIQFDGAVDSPDVTVSYLSQVDGLELPNMQVGNDATPR
jgi:hypothetical protein